MAERSTDLGTYQMLWDCPYCGTPKLLALDHKHCPACGGAQDPTRRYFPKDDEKIAVEGHVFVGKDKICGACEAPTRPPRRFVALAEPPWMAQKRPRPERISGKTPQAVSRPIPRGPQPRSTATPKRRPPMPHELHPTPRMVHHPKNRALAVVFPGKQSDAVFLRYWS